MNEQMQKINDFLRYKVTNQNANDTDKVAWMFIVEKPELLNAAKKAVFDTPTTTLNNDSPNILKAFLTENIEEFEDCELDVNPENVDYNAIILAFFL